MTTYLFHMSFQQSEVTKSASSCVNMRKLYCNYNTFFEINLFEYLWQKYETIVYKFHNLLIHSIAAVSYTHLLRGSERLETHIKQMNPMFLSSSVGWGSSFGKFLSSSVAYIGSRWKFLSPCEPIATTAHQDLLLTIIEGWMLLRNQEQAYSAVTNRLNWLNSISVFYYSVYMTYENFQPKKS